MKKFNRIVKISSFLYPVLVFFCVYTGSKFSLNILSFVVILLNFAYSNAKLLIFQILATISIGLLMLCYFPENIYRLTPFLISTSVLSHFINKYLNDENIFLLAISKYKKVLPTEIKYLDKLFLYWIIFLCFNSLVLLYLMFFESQNTWMFYACFLSYILIIIMIFLSIIFGRIYSKKNCS